MEFLLSTLNFWHTPSDISHTIGGMQTTGWEPLVYENSTSILFAP